MANVTLMGASYSDVPAVTLPQTGGGTVTFYENGGGGVDLFYVTPEEYGAVGDGVTDDSQAVQDACDAGYAVYFASNKTYYLGSAVTIDHDCHLFGGENTVIKTKTPSSGTINDGIVVQGTLKKTTTLTSNYSAIGTTTANAGNRFKLTDMTDIEVGDIMVITAEDQYFSYNRPYYYLGGTLEIADMTSEYLFTIDAMPWDITNSADVSVKIYSAPTAIVENLHFVSDTDSSGTYKYCVKFAWCKNSVIRNCDVTDMDNGFQIWECVNTLVDDLSIANTSGASDSPLKDHYGIALYSSANTIISRVLGECGSSAIDMSGHTPNMNTYIKNCNLFATYRISGIGMHENAYNTVIEDSIIGGVTGYGTMFVNRCRFVQRNRQQDSNVAIVYRGSHRADWARLLMSDCIIEGSNLQVSVAKPVPDDPIQAYDNVVGEINITNCVGGTFVYVPTTDSTILSNTINRVVLDGWRDCKEIYHTSAGIIDDLIVKDCSFTEKYYINDHDQSHGVYLDGIHNLDYSNSIPLAYKIHKNATVYADNAVLPEGVTITLASNSQSAKFRVCGANLTPNVADDYQVGTVSGSVGGDLTIGTSNAATITIDSNGDPVHTQGNVTSTNSFFPVGMVYVREPSVATISAKLKNTGDTDGASFRPYIAIVSCDTGKIVYRNNGTGGTASAEGASVSHTRTVPENSVVLCYFYCNSVVKNAVTTFDDMAITIESEFIGPVVNDEYIGKRRTGDGTLTSVAGVNNIMCSEATFTVKYGADLVNNPVGLLLSASGVSF